jgi:hypothetical protein
MLNVSISVDHSPSLEANSRSAVQDIPLPFMKLPTFYGTAVLLSCLPELIIKPYPESNGFSLHAL